MAQRPFRILGLQQIAVGGTDKARLCARCGSTRSGSRRPAPTAASARTSTRTSSRSGSGAFKVEVDIMQPIDAAKKPAVHDPALNHIGLWVDDLAAAVAWLTAQGMRFTPGGIRKGAAGYDVCFIHPKGNEATPLSRRGRADRARPGAARRDRRARRLTAAGVRAESPAESLRSALDRGVLQL